jgi:hypothetical protein
MGPPQLEMQERWLLDVMTDAFNRSLNALEASGAIDLTQLRSEYRGVGSKYYDLVTQEMLTVLGHRRSELDGFLTNQSGNDA